MLQDVSVSIRPGERVALTGRSGSGKTLLMRAVGMLDPLAGGEIRWRGERVAGPRAPAFRGRVAYLPQRAAIWEGDVEQNLRVPFSFMVHRGRRYDREAAISMLRALGRDASFLAKRNDNLSGGEMQIVALLRALQLEPEVLLLDEPTAALDAETATAAETLIGNWIGEMPEQRAFVWSSHDAEQATRVASRRLRIADGRLKE